MASIKKLDERKYFIRASKGTGKNRQVVNDTFRGTLAEARKFAREQETLLDQGYSAAQITKTFEAYAEHWLASITVKKRTKEFYETILRCYAKSLNDRKLRTITSDHIQDIYNQMKALELSPNTIRHLHSTLRVMFNFAVKKKHLKENPCQIVDQPAKVKPEIVFFDELEAGRFWRECQTAVNGLIFEFALETGMRPEEYTALRRTDLSFLYATASVNRVVCFNRKGGGFYYEETKTDGSRRLVPLSAPLLDRLKEHLETHESELLFPNALGNPYDLNNLTRRYLNPIIKEAGVKRITLYCLRHTCATLLLMAGVNPKIVADRLGHSSVTLTLDTYSHVLPHIQAGATDKLSEIMRGAHFLRREVEAIQ